MAEQDSRVITIKVATLRNVGSIICLLLAAFLAGALVQAITGWPVSLTEAR